MHSSIDSHQCFASRPTARPPPPPFMMPMNPEPSQVSRYRDSRREAAVLCLGTDLVRGHVVHYQTGGDYQYQVSGWHGSWFVYLGDGGRQHLRLFFRFNGDQATMLRNLDLQWDDSTRQWVHLTLPIAMEALVQ